MKKSAYILGLAALLLAACTLEKPSGDALTPTGETTTLTVSLDAPETRIAFAGEAGGKTKTAWSAEDKLWVRSDTQPAWERGDCFRTAADKISADGHSATFTGVTRKDGKLAVAYPYERVADGADNACIRFDLPQSLEMVAGNAPALTHAAVGVVSDGSAKLTLSFVLGALKVALTGNGEAIGGVELIDADESVALWGSCAVTPDYESGKVSVAMENESAGRNSVMLTCQGAKLSATPLTFYFMLPEGALAKGFILRVYSADGGQMKQFSTASAANTIARGKVVILPAVDYTSAPVLSDFSGGTGTATDPFLLKTADDLIELSTKVNAEASHEKYASGYYRQAADIDMSGKTFIPIGKSEALAFAGHFDGRGLKIAGLAADGESSDNPASGLFGYLKGAEITDVTVAGRTNAGTYGNVGGIAGKAWNTKFTGCTVDGGTLKTGNSYAGGLVSYLEGGEITNCTVTGLAIESAHNHIGGLVGELFDGAVSGCTARGVKIAGKQNVGGFIGWFDKGSVTNCLLTQAEVTGSGDGVGGFTGRTISKKGATNLYDKCRVEDSVIKGAYSVGGIIGYAYPDANGPVLVYNSGILKTTVRATACDTGGDPAKGDSMIAGICGWMRASDNASSAKIVNCYIHFAPGGLVCDLPMVNASAGAILGYVSLSAAGTIEVANCCTSLGADDLVVGGSPVGSSSARYGALYGMLPDRTITVKHNYCVSGLPMTGSTGASVVLSENESVPSGELASVREKLDSFTQSYTDHALSAWKMEGQLPVVE